jgi:hypothetical protein
VFFAGGKSKENEKRRRWKRKVRSWHDPPMIYHEVIERVKRKFAGG